MKLRCNHPCIGLCGEECPLVCRVCEPKNEIFKAFFGKEDSLDSRFIMIDCGHTFEVKGFDHYIHSEEGVVGLKTCPRCKKFISHTKRYTTLINGSFNDINTVKEIVKNEDIVFLG